MNRVIELKKLKLERDVDTEWLVKYKRIVDGLKEHAYIYFDGGCETEWGAMAFSLDSLSKLMQEDLDGRNLDELNKEEAK